MGGGEAGDEGEGGEADIERDLGDVEMNAGRVVGYERSMDSSG